jgi:serine/threonine protein kinase/tetratricopeptide (TPR) repeat protein/TolB-like protein
MANVAFIPPAARDHLPVTRPAADRVACSIGRRARPARERCDDLDWSFVTNPREVTLPLSPGQTITHYRLLESLGEGGMGVVWKAEDTRLGRPVALKFLPAEAVADPERRRMFVDEARLASSLSDARIAQVYDVGEEGDLHYIAMELVEGKPLDLLIHGRPLPSDKVVMLGTQVAQALTRAHRRGLLHRDIKPANVMVGPEGEVKLVDFGLAALMTRAEPEETAETTASRLRVAADAIVGGTLPYSSPEQLRSEPLDGRSDIYSLGVMLYEMTTGQRPFAGRTSWALAEEVLRGRPKPVHELVPKVPVELERIIQKAMATKPGERYQTADDLVVDLQRLQRELDTDSSPSYADLRDRLDKRKRGRTARWVMGAVATALIAVAAWWFGPWRSEAVDPKRLLVLPFEVQGQGEEGIYLGRAMAQAVAVNLATVKSLIVLAVPPTRSNQNLEPAFQMKQARTLGAGRYVTGFVIRSGDSVRVNVTLCETKSGRIKWGGFSSGDERDLTSTASYLARMVEEEIGVVPSRHYDYIGYLRGSPLMAKSVLVARTQAAVRETDLEEGEKATAGLCAEFPREPDAHALRAWMLSWQSFNRGDSASMDSMNAELEKLHQLDPNHPYFEIMLAIRARDVGRNHEAADLLSKVLARDDLTPAARSHALRQHAACWTGLGQYEDSVKEIEEALTLDPLTAANYELLSRALSLAGRPEDALTRAQQGVAIAPHNWLLHDRVGLALMLLGRYDQAWKPLSAACDLSRLQSPCADYATALFRAGHRAEADSAAAHATSLTPTKWGQFNLATYWTLAGNKPEAIRHLRHSVAMGFADEELFKEHNLDALRSEPEFKKIAAEVRRKLAAH